ncbi:phospholipid scramblase 1 [Brienomyrus brachyistius]|uniref:phospholipid scramblase 1 n=1 Tax=Brienomyrus brachyistius TaxID=42636 RepID=UPI0020B188A8|nr:phospholipid scramblase 1 [Brienomyrus brachyistius]
MEQTGPLIGVPPGLEYLTQIDQILIHQKMELLEVLCGFENNNQYEIKNIMGQTIYKALEETNCCVRNMCGSLRRFNLMIKDNMDQEVMHLVRPWRCTGCCFPCCLQELEVQAPPGTVVGYVVEDWHPILPKFSILGPSRETVLKLDGPCLLFNCCGDVKFELKGKDGQETVGQITKQWGGLLKEILTDTDNFGIQFPMDLDIRMKAVLVGACFLIDFMYFEKAGDGDNVRSCLSS